MQASTMNIHFWGKYSKLFDSFIFILTLIIAPCLKQNLQCVCVTTRTHIDLQDQTSLTPTSQLTIETGEPLKLMSPVMQKKLSPIPVYQYLGLPLELSHFPETSITKPSIIWTVIVRTGKGLIKRSDGVRQKFLCKIITTRSVADNCCHFRRTCKTYANQDLNHMPVMSEVTNCSLILTLHIYLGQLLDCDECSRQKVIQALQIE